MIRKRKPAEVVVPDVVGYEIVRAGERVPFPADNAGGVVMRAAPTDGVLLRGRDKDASPIFLSAADVGALRDLLLAPAEPA